MDASHAEHAGRVEEQDYYHINRNVAWSPYGPLNVGDEIDFGDSSNPFFRYFETQQRTQNVNINGNPVRVPDIQFLRMLSDGNMTTTMTVRDLASFARDLANHFMMYARELLFEDVRRSEFTHLPSRQRCGWLIPEWDGVKFWLGRMNVGGQFQVVRVRVWGNLHTGSDAYLLHDSEPMTQTLENARRYWRGEPAQMGTEEVLFEGRMRVVEVMPPASDA